MERLRQDTEYALRLLARSPAFTAVAVLSLAIGTGAVSAIVGQINAVFWKTLPVSKPAELRILVWTSPVPGFVMGPNVLAGPRVPVVGDTFGSFSYPAYASMRDGSRSFSDLACWADLGEARPVFIREMGPGSVQFVSGNYFQTLGVPAALGRTILPADDRPGSASLVAVVSDRFWRRALGGDRGVTKQTLELNGKPFEVVGVMPEGFFGLDPAVSPDVMVPIGAVQIAAATSNPLGQNGIWSACRVVGRVRAGVSNEEARVEAGAWIREAILAAPPSQSYEMPRLWLVDASRGLSTLRAATSTPLRVLLTVVSGLLLIVCANIAGLLIARGTAREKEMATRLALGAPRARLIRQLVTESLVLSLIGGAAGSGLAYALSRFGPSLLSRFLPTRFAADRYLSVTATPDLSALVFALAVAVLAGLGFGLVPALRTTRVDLLSSIKQMPALGVRRRFRFGGGQGMVALQAALSMLLLIEAGLFARTLLNLRSSELGYEPRGLLYVKAEPRASGYSLDRRQEFFETAVKRLEGTPGVLVASASSRPLLGYPSELGPSGGIPFCTPELIAQGRRDEFVQFNFVEPRFFETMRIPFLLGRDLEWRDYGRGVEPVAVAVINQALANKYYAGKHPIGRKLGFNCPSNPEEVTVVGVVADTRSSPRVGVEPTVYLPLRGYGDPPTLILRTGDPAAIIEAVRRLMAELDSSVPVFGATTPVDLREQHLRRERLLTHALTLFGVVALFLSCLGIYGMLSYSVARRTSEIGIRMAIGAQGPDVVRMVIRESLAPVVAGVAVGCVSAFAVTRWVESMLFGVSRHDPVTIVGATLLFLFVAVTAAALPARHACRIDPLRALRGS